MVAADQESLSTTMPIHKASPPPPPPPPHDSDDHSSDSTGLDFIINPIASSYPSPAAADNDDVDEDLAFVRSLPEGYRFCPLDEELLVCYLRKRVNNEPLPRNLIKEVELYKYNPEQLADKYREYGEKEWYFFTPRDRKYQNGGRPKRSAGNGYWKATGADKQIKVQGNIVGFRKALVFYYGKPPKGEKTNWIMHEYRVSNPPPRPPPTDHPDKPRSMMLDKCVLCRIYKKDDKPSARSTGQREGVNTTVAASMEDIDCDDDGYVMDSNEVTSVNINPNSINIISPNSGTITDQQYRYMPAAGAPQISPELITPYYYQDLYTQSNARTVLLGSTHHHLDQYVQPLSSSNFAGHMMPRSRFMQAEPQRFMTMTEPPPPPPRFMPMEPSYADDCSMDMQYPMAETAALTEFFCDNPDDHQVNSSFHLNPYMFQKDHMKTSPK